MALQEIAEGIKNVLNPRDHLHLWRYFWLGVALLASSLAGIGIGFAAPVYVALIAIILAGIPDFINSEIYILKFFIERFSCSKCGAVILDLAVFILIFSLVIEPMLIPLIITSTGIGAVGGATFLVSVASVFLVTFATAGIIFVSDKLLSSCCRSEPDNYAVVAQYEDDRDGNLGRRHERRNQNERVSGIEPPQYQDPTLRENPGTSSNTSTHQELGTRGETSQDYNNQGERSPVTNSSQTFFYQKGQQPGENNLANAANTSLVTEGEVSPKYDNEGLVAANYGHF